MIAKAHTQPAVGARRTAPFDVPARQETAPVVGTTLPFPLFFKQFLYVDHLLCDVCSRFGGAAIMTYSAGSLESGIVVIAACYQVGALR